MEAARGADALVIVTEWKEFRSPDFEELKRALKQPVIFDGRNLYEPESVRAQGLEYFTRSGVAGTGAEAAPWNGEALPDFSRARASWWSGDVMLDRYWFGEVSRISPEAPVPVVHVKRTEERPGGAANVARNVAALAAHGAAARGGGKRRGGRSPRAPARSRERPAPSLHRDPALSTPRSSCA